LEVTDTAPLQLNKYIVYFWARGRTDWSQWPFCVLVTAQVFNQFHI